MLELYEMGEVQGSSLCNHGLRLDIFSTLFELGYALVSLV